VFFQTKSESVDWITMALRTITHEQRDLQQVSIHVASVSASADANIRQVIGEAARQQWLDLDQFLVQFSESRSIRPVVKYQALIGEGRGVRDCIGWLMPEVTRRGIIDLVE